jgi:hypothetical protein
MIATSARYHPTVISAHRGWFDRRLRQLWRCRDLISLFVERDFVTQYKQTILGPASDGSARSWARAIGIEAGLDRTIAWWRCKDVAPCHPLAS